MTTATRNWTRRRFFAAAEQAGREITINRDAGTADVKRRSIIIRVWADGSCTRADVRNDLALKMTYREAAKALGLK